MFGSLLRQEGPFEFVRGGSEPVLVVGGRAGHGPGRLGRAITIHRRTPAGDRVTAGCWPLTAFIGLKEA